MLCFSVAATLLHARQSFSRRIKTTKSVFNAPGPALRVSVTAIQLHTYVDSYCMS